MNSDTFNWLAMAALSALLLIFGTPVLIHALTGGYDKHEVVAGYKLPVEVAAVDPGGAAGGASEPQGFQFANVVAKLGDTTAEAGERLFKQCQSCHTVNDGGRNGIGPNLWDVVGRAKGAVDGFSYSNALKEKGGEWDYERLALFLHDPKGWMSGTKMAYRGLKKEEDVAAMLLYLRTLSGDPKPLPEASN